MELPVILITFTRAKKNVLEAAKRIEVMAGLAFQVIVRVRC